MKKHHWFLIGLITLSALVGCSNPYQELSEDTVRGDRIKECWMREVDLNSNHWVTQADRWFLTGEPNRIERKADQSRIESVMTTLSVRVPNFTKIQVNGDFQIQIQGNEDLNSVNVMGPNNQTRQIAFEVHDNTLYIRQGNDPLSAPKDTLIRIGIRNLTSLVNQGDSFIEGRDLTSTRLRLCSEGNSIILLKGEMNLRSVNQTGTGVITVLGAYTPTLDIESLGKNQINISGRVGIHTITTKGMNTIKIVGADSDDATIHAEGGITTLAGNLNLKRIDAFGDSKVYAYWVNTPETLVFAHDNARVGLAGRTQNLNVALSEESRFEGSYFHGTFVSVKTRAWSHANVMADQKLFAAAFDSSSIYYLGSATAVSRYTSNRGLVIPG